VTVVLPVMNQSQTQAWQALLAIHRAPPAGWRLVDGKMVHLHCLERRVTPNRPTDNAVIDWRDTARRVAPFGIVGPSQGTSRGE
jgi:hypothetical protein